MELISLEEISSVAVTYKFIIRSRKIRPEEFLLTLLFGFYSKEEPSITKLHRLYNSLVSPENRVVYSSFYERFTEDAVLFMDACLKSLLSKEIGCVNSELKGYIREFQDILIIDNTIVRVHLDLAEKYPATRTRRAAAERMGAGKDRSFCQQHQSCRQRGSWKTQRIWVWIPHRRLCRVKRQKSNRIIFW